MNASRLPFDPILRITIRFWTRRSYTGGSADHTILVGLMRRTEGRSARSWCCRVSLAERTLHSFLVDALAVFLRSFHHAMTVAVADLHVQTPDRCRGRAEPVDHNTTDPNTTDPKQSFRAFGLTRSALVVINQQCTPNGPLRIVTN